VKYHHIKIFKTNSYNFFDYQRVHFLYNIINKFDVTHFGVFVVIFVCSFLIPLNLFTVLIVVSIATVLLRSITTVSQIIYVIKSIILKFYFRVIIQ